MIQAARRAVDEVSGALRHIRFVLHDRDTKFCNSFRTILTSGGVQPLAMPPRSPNLNAFAERWVRSVKSECLSKFILSCETLLRRVVIEYLEHYHYERNHQGRNNLLLFERFDPTATTSTSSKVGRKERLGGLLNNIRAA
jgi:putative transposase